MTPRKCRASAGFTLVELMIAVLILTVGLMGMLSAMAMTVRVLGEGDRSVVAAYHASERLEKLEALGCDNVTAGSETLPKGYSLKWTVTGTPTSQVRDVYLAVEYPGVQGQARADTFERAMPCVR